MHQEYSYTVNALPPYTNTFNDHDRSHAKGFLVLRKAQVVYLECSAYNFDTLTQSTLSKIQCMQPLCCILSQIILA
jgi:hypothetical protein